MSRHKRRRARAALLLFASCALAGAVAFFSLSARPPFVTVRTEGRAGDDVASPVARALLSAQAVAPASLSGAVRDRAGAAIAGALVCASCASCDDAALPASACTKSDASGAYALQSMAAAVVVSASAPSFALGHAHGGLPVLGGEAHQGLDIVLERGGARVAGVVVDALGGPVAEARVRLLRFSASVRSLLETSADADGRFELWTAPGQVVVRAEAPGYAAVQRSRIAPSEDIELRMTPASVVRGRVVALGSGDAVAGVEVRAIPRSSPIASAVALSDAAGDFSLAALEPGFYQLVAVSDRWRGQAPAPLEVGLVEVIEAVTVTVGPAVRVAGQVTIGAGAQPCPRGLVILESLHAGTAAAPDVPTVVGRIGADGHVPLQGLTPGRYRADVQCLEHVLSEGPRELTVGDDDLEARWRVSRGLALVVNAVDEAGQPVPHARMLLVMPPAHAGAQPSAMSIAADAHGRAVLASDLQPGSYSVEPDLGLQGQPVSFELRTAASASATEVTLRLQGSAAIVVAVSDEQGRGVSSLQLNARSLADDGGAAQSVGVLAQARSSLGVLAVEIGGGRYRMGPLAGGRYAVEVHDGINPQREVAGERGAIELRGGELRELQLRLARGGFLRGRVVDDRGQPEANVWVTASADEERSRGAWLGRMRNPPVPVMTDLEGGFTIDGLAPGGRFIVQAKQPHGSAAALRDVAEASTVTLVLPAPATIRGRLVDAQGTAITGGEVHAHHAETRTTRSATLLADGTFAIEQVPPGRVTVSAGDAASLLARTEVELAAGQALTGLRLVAAPAEAAQAHAPAVAAPAPGTEVEPAHGAPADTRTVE